MHINHYNTQVQSFISLLAISMVRPALKQTAYLVGETILNQEPSFNSNKNFDLLQVPSAPLKNRLLELVSPITSPIVNIVSEVANKTLVTGSNLLDGIVYLSSGAKKTAETVDNTAKVTAKATAICLSVLSWIQDNPYKSAALIITPIVTHYTVKQFLNYKDIKNREKLALKNQEAGELAIKSAALVYLTTQENQRLLKENNALKSRFEPQVPLLN